MTNSPHEGLCFPHQTCSAIVSFLENNTDMRQDLFQHVGQIEEFAFQSIASNMEAPFYYLGNGCCSEAISDKKTVFIYKTKRE